MNSFCAYSLNSRLMNAASLLMADTFRAKRRLSTSNSSLPSYQISRSNYRRYLPTGANRRRVSKYTYLAQLVRPTRPIFGPLDTFRHLVKALTTNSTNGASKWTAPKGKPYEKQVSEASTEGTF